VNKIDKPVPIPTHPQELVAQGITPKNGRYTQLSTVSAKANTNIDGLLDAIQWQAEVLEFAQPVTGSAKGIGHRIRLDKGRARAHDSGAICTLRRGDMVLAGQVIRPRARHARRSGQTRDRAGPSIR